MNTPFVSRTSHHAIALLALLCPFANAQSTSQPTSPPPANPFPAESEKQAVPQAFADLENAPTRIDALNLNIFLPKGSVTNTTSVGSNSSMGVGLPDQVGVMIIKEQRTTDPDLTVSSITENLITQLSRFANSKTGTLLARYPNLEINGHLGERFYIRLPGVNGKPDTVRGMTVFQHQPRRFLIFDFTCLAKDFEVARNYYETSVGSMDLGNMTQIDMRRAAAIKSMLAFMDSRTIKDYQKAMTGKKDHWERLYLPSATGDEMDATEYGYRKIKSWGGFKGELTDKPKRSWNEDDQSLGYFVQIDAMALEDGVRVDTRATFYMSEDTREESWTIKMSLRQDGVQTTSVITGARSDKSMAIMLDQPPAAPTRTHPLIQGEGYISQVQTYLIGAMLAHDADPGEYASYAYNSSLGTISLRWDIVEKPEDTPGVTRVTTKTSNDSPPTVSVYNAKGDLMRVRLANGRIWEPIELDRLIKLWKKKGLPLE